VLFAGQLIQRKGADVLIGAFAMAGRRESRLRLLLLGSGPDRDKLEASVPDQLRNRVLFLGHQSPNVLPSVFASADAFCLPSRHDGWGVVVNEALGAGLPMIVSDAVGAGRDLVVDGVNGIVTRAGDATSLAVALEQIADSAFRSRLAIASEGISKQWNLDEGVNRWRNAATELLNSDAHTNRD
jgi:glycosyltransferase involved in cell wall biosynthesis